MFIEKIQAINETPKIYGKLRFRPLYARYIFHGLFHVANAA
jgi:hypothetical protein